MLLIYSIALMLLTFTKFVPLSESRHDSRNLYLSLEAFKILFISCQSCRNQSSVSEISPALYYWHRIELRLLPNLPTAIRLGFNETEGAIEITSDLFNEVRHGEPIPSLVMNPSLQNAKHTHISMKLELQRIHLMQGPPLIYSTYKIGDYLNPSFIRYEPHGNIGRANTTLLMSHRGKPSERFNSFMIWSNDILNRNDPELKKFDLHSNDAYITSEDIPIHTYGHLKDAEDIRFVKTPHTFKTSASNLPINSSMSAYRVSIVYTKIVSYKDPVTGYMAIATVYYDRNTNSVEMTDPIKLQTDSEIVDNKRVYVEKNWTPFVVNDILYFVYSICPFHVITIDFNSTANTNTQLVMKTVSRTQCHVDKSNSNNRRTYTRRNLFQYDSTLARHDNTENPTINNTTVAHSNRNSNLNLNPSLHSNGHHRQLITQDLSLAKMYHHNHRFIWDWGELRGGSTALLVNNKFFLTFFHSRKYIHSDYGIRSWFETYFFGAYTFSMTPPFRILKISRAPIVLDEWYSGTTVHGNPFLDYVVFPLSAYITNETVRVFEGDKEIDVVTPVITLSVGRNDREAWMAKIRLDELLSSLVTVHH